MPNYHRDRTPGGTWCFTVVTQRRAPVLTQPDVRRALRAAITTTRSKHPFEIIAWVLLPDHAHCLWSLPPDDADFSTRWSMIKRLTTQASRGFGARGAPYADTRARRHEGTLLQRRFWEHRIRDDVDLRHHMDYLLWNPVKHGLVERVADWPWSSFHRLVKMGIHPMDWGDKPPLGDGIHFGE